MYKEGIHNYKKKENILRDELYVYRNIYFRILGSTFMIRKQVYNTKF